MSLTAHVHAAVDWIRSHPAETWLIASLVINVALRAKTPEQWVALAERQRVLAACLEVVRALGVDPVRAIRAVQLLAAAKAGGGAAARIIGSPPADDGPSTPRSGGGAP